MKKLKLFFAALFLLVGISILVPTTSAMAAGEWIPVGKFGFTSINIGGNIYFDNNAVPYVIYSDSTNGNKATVYKNVSGTWQLVGSAGFSADTLENSYLYFDASNTPHVVYTENSTVANRKITISQFVSGNWETVSSVFVSTLGSFALVESLSVSEDAVPYFFVADSANGSKITALKFNGTNWEVVGNALFSAGSVSRINSTISQDGTPYAAFIDGASSSKLTVMKYNSASTVWETVGTTGFSTNAVYNSYKTISISTDNNVPYVAYLNTSLKPYVQKYNGSSWEDVGASASLPATSKYLTLKFDSNSTPYISYHTTSNKVNVIKLVDVTWTTVGTANFSNGVSGNPFLEITNNTPYVSYVDSLNGGGITVVRLTEAAETYYTGSITESSFNDGSVSGGITANLVNKSFISSSTTLTLGTHYTINNKPVGLTPSVVTDSTGKKATLTFSGVASYHSDADDVSNLTISFLDDAFSGGNAAGVANSLVSNLAIDFYSRPYAASVFLGMSTTTIKYDGESDLVIGSDNIPYLFDPECVAAACNPYYARVKKYVDSSWISLGEAGTSTTAHSYHSMALDSNNFPYVAYRSSTNSSKITVYKYDGSSWSLVGPAGFSTSTVEYTDIALDTNNVPYVAYHDDANGSRLTVMKFNGTSWEVVGAAGFSISTATYINIEIGSDNVPYVAFQDAGASAGKARVMKFNGTAWVNLNATPGISSGTVSYVSLSLDSNNIPYVAFSNTGNSSKAEVMRFNVASTTWEVLSGAVSGNYAYYTVIRLDSNNIPYVAYQDGLYNDKITVKRLVNGAWEVVGLSGFSVGQATKISMSIDNNGNPYVSYMDSVDKFAVVKLVLPPVIDLLAASKTDSTISLSWEVSEGEGEINSYLVKYKTIQSDTWTIFTDSLLNGTTTVTGLDSKTEYDSEVSAINSAGVNSEPISTRLTTEAPAPTDLSYATSSVFLYINQAIATSSPTVTGDVVSYEISPALPTGLSLNTSTGVISGAPTVSSTSTVYTITASNLTGFDSFELTIEVIPVAPAGLSYTTPVSYSIGDRIEPLTPTVTGDEIVYSVSPNLPAGLSLDTTTGIISGTSTALTASSTYVVTAANSTGSDSFGVVMAIVSTPNAIIYDTPNNLISDGIMSPQNGNASSTTIVKFNQKINIVPFTGASIVIPSGITMTAANSFDTVDIIASTADVSDLAAITPAGALMFGLPDLGLTLSSPITITIPVTGFADGRVLKVYTKTAGGSWQELTSCSVLANKCSFETTHLSEFAAGTSTTSGDNSSNSSPVIITSCTSVVYSDFSQVCANGYQYRNFISQSPLGCSITKAQIEAARKLCGEVATTTDISIITPIVSQIKSQFIALERSLVSKVNKLLTNKLIGRILLQVEEKGEAWYINPVDSAKYFLGSPSDAFNLMRKLALGINNKTFNSFKNNIAPSRLSGRILLNVEDNGKAYYVNPVDLKIHYLGRPDDAFKVMRGVGLGITNNNLRQIEVGEIK